MKKSLKLFLSLLFFCQTYVFAQNITVTGKVTGPGNEALAGVSVNMSGSKQGVMTDVEGNFTISAPTNGTLVFSYVGFDVQNIKINGRSVINVSLLSNTDNMQAVVVTALGIKKEVR